MSNITDITDLDFNLGHWPYAVSFKVNDVENRWKHVLDLMDEYEFGTVGIDYCLGNNSTEMFVGFKDPDVLTLFRLTFGGK